MLGPELQIILKEPWPQSLNKRVSSQNVLMCVKRDKLTMQVHKYIYVFKYSIKQKVQQKSLLLRRKQFSEKKDQGFF